VVNEKRHWGDRMSLDTSTQQIAKPLREIARVLRDIKNELEEMKNLLRDIRNAPAMAG